MIKIRGLYKSYNSKKLVLDNVDFDIKKGEIFGIVGTNGAGKTTLINHITGISIGDYGKVLIDEENVYENEKIKSKMAFLPDDLFFIYGYSIKKMARYYKGLFPNWSEDKYNLIISELKIDENKKISNFSKGMKRQAGFVLALSTMPDYLILDEPLDGLDPLVRNKIKKIIFEEVAERNMSVLISSHNLDEIENICDRVAIMDNAKVLEIKQLDSSDLGVHKIQLAYKEDKPEFDNLEVIDKTIIGNVITIIVQGDKLEVIEKINETKPIIFDILPLSLDELFITKVGGSYYE